MADRGHPDHDVDERIGAVSSPLGATLRPVAACPAGDVCAVARLTAAETGDTLSSPDDPRLVPPWDLDRKSTRLNSSHANISYAVFCLKKKKKNNTKTPHNYTNDMQ